MLNWLLPGIRPTKKEIVLVLVSIISFDQNGKITLKRMYWDQASVLRQIGVLPQSLYCKANSSEAILPIKGADILDGFNSMNFETPVTQEGQLAQKVSKIDINSTHTNLFEERDDSFRSSTKVVNKSGSNIFESGNEEYSKKLNRKDPNHINEMADHKQGVRHYEGKNESQIFFGSDDKAPANYHHRRHDPTNNVSHINFKDEAFEPVAVPARRDPNARSEVTEENYVRPSSRVLAVPGGAQSFTIGGNYDDDYKSAQVKRRDPNARSEISEENYVRPSSRVLAVPGGAQSFSIGEDYDDHKAVHIKRRDPNARSQTSDENYVRPSSRVLAPPGGGQTFHFS
jgi:hypothetical protein